MDALEMNMETALQEVFKQSAQVDGYITGFNQVARALEKKMVSLCFLAENCDEKNYTSIIEALCAQHKIPLVKVDDNKKLGEYAGRCKRDDSGNARKVVTSSCAAILEMGEETSAYTYLLNKTKA